MLETDIMTADVAGGKEHIESLDTTNIESITAQNHYIKGLLLKLLNDSAEDAFTFLDFGCTCVSGSSSGCRRLRLVFLVHDSRAFLRTSTTFRHRRFLRRRGSHY
jgi:hypothetical protein